MSGPSYAAQGHAFPDVPFAGAADDQGPIQSIDFSSSRAFFGQLEGSRSPAQTDTYRYARDEHPAAVSGIDPVSRLVFASGRSKLSKPSANRDLGTASGSMDQTVHDATKHPFDSLPVASEPQTPDTGSVSQSQIAPILGQHGDEAAHRTAEVERRNKLREQERARRTLAIQKQVNDGMEALKLEKDDAAQRSAEVERRNKVREEEKAQRKLAIQKQVEDGIKAIKLEKDRLRARVEADRKACRKWLSDVPKSEDPRRPISTSSSPSLDVHGAIGRQMRGFWENSRPSASSQTQRAEVIADVQRAIDNKWPGQDLKVAAFGSSITGLVTNTSDLDLVLLDPTRPFGVGTPSELCFQPNKHVRHSEGMPEWYSTNQIANTLRASNRFRSVVPISGASVPIVKMVHRKYGIPADININERFGLFNSQLIFAYADLQPELVRPLIFFLKHWFGQRELNDPAGKRGSMTFSSYTIALMALQVLQLEGVLPNLQDPELLDRLHVQPSFLYSRAKRPRARRGKNRSNGGVANEGIATTAEDVTPPQKYNVTFASKFMHAETCTSKGLQIANSRGPNFGNNSSASDRLLGRMLVAFVKFYSQLDRRTQAVSVVKGSPLRRRRGSQPTHVFFDSASEDGVVQGNAGPADAVTNHLQFVPADFDGGKEEIYDEETDVWSGDEIVVQDPFITDRNTARNIKGQAIERWQGEMERALRLLGVALPIDAPMVTPESAPLILDLCIPQDVLSDMEATSNGVAGISGSVDSKDPWQVAEETASQEREMAKQAAQALRKEKKKRAKRSKRREARLLQEEAAMVEDMIDGIETGRVSGMMDSNEPHERWRLRVDSHDGSQTNGGSTLTPFTFSVVWSPARPLVSLPKRQTAQQQADR